MYSGCSNPITMSIMVKSYRKNSIAIARNFQHNPADDNPSPPSDCETYSSSESDCGYKGGVNYDSSDDEYDSADLDENWSSDESLAEL